MTSRVPGRGAWLRALLREPLVHFLLLGGLIFAIDAWLAPAPSGPASAEIVVKEAQIRSLAQNFQRTWQRPPTKTEMDGLVETHVREEVMVREALALGLDRDDTIIRRRLQQKVEFVSEQAAALIAPDDADLSAYLDANPGAFAVPGRYTFRQVYLDPARRGANLAADAQRLAERLNASGAPDPASLGDPLRLLEARYADEPGDAIARTFGGEFADALAKLPVGAWAGPVTSGYGAHVVKVEAAQPGGKPPLDAVRAAVEREWRSAKRQELSAAYYAKLRSKYNVRIDWPQAAKP